MKKALIFGVDGQDGSYLAELLLSKGYEVTGWIPENIPVNLGNIRHILGRITLVKGDLSNQRSLAECFDETNPDEIYNLAAPSFPATSWDSPVLTGDIAGLGVGRLLEATRLICPDSRFYQASTSELFGIPTTVPQNESTPFHPRNPYGVAKLYAHWMVHNYYEHYGLFAVSGILFNHESPRRGLDFVTRKITHTVAKIYLSQENELRLGDLDARRDWGFAGDYIQAMWMMMQQEKPEGYVVGTGETHSVRDLCQIAFGCLELDYTKYVIQDERFIRPHETRQLVADPSKARQQLGWKPMTTFEQLICMMVEKDLDLLRNPLNI